MEKSEPLQSMLQGYDEMARKNSKLSVKMKGCAEMGWKKRREADISAKH